MIDAAVARKDKVNAAAHARTPGGRPPPPGAADQYDAAARGLDLSIAHPPGEGCTAPSSVPGSLPAASTTATAYVLPAESIRISQKLYTQFDYMAQQLAKPLPEIPRIRR